MVGIERLNGPASAMIQSEDSLEGSSTNTMDNSSPSEKQLDTLWSWNASVSELVEGRVHDLISEIAESQPDALAVCAWDGDFTYAQLDALADAVARRLIGLGYGPKSNIPLLFNKSRWTPIAMLAVIKAGCAAIALDASHPDSRLRSIVQQAQPKIILSSAGNHDRAKGLVDVPVLQLDNTLLDTLNDSEEKAHELPVVPTSDYVYISFTSGTTGQPKGACISHANVRSTVHYQGHKLGFGRGSRVLDFAPYSFDVAWSNFLHTLCAGGCICIPAEQDMLNDLSAAITAFKATLINVTPTVLRTISPIPPSLETVLLSGEMPYRENVTKWAGRVRLLNTYGPSECTFKCAFSVLSPSLEGRPDIGKGVGFCIWIVDPNDSDKLVAPGSTGELCLEGPMVGQGYLSDPKKTAEAFINDPPWLLAGSRTFTGRKGRLYKTGDLVKFRADGRILFVGRKEVSQLKVRGQRIEIGDVEHHVRACLDDALPIIVDIVVPHGSESSSLALFVHTNGLETERVKALLDGLSEKLSDVLPAFMIPSLYLPVDEIPVASTGKVDRRRLREMGSALAWDEIVQLQSKIISVAEHREPSNDVERKLRQLWAQTLELDPHRISTTDSFLRLGGDSVAAMHLVAAAREEGLSLTVADVFTTPILSDLASVVKAETIVHGEDEIIQFSLLNGEKDTESLCADASRLCGVQVADIEDIYPCTPLQLGMLAMTAKGEVVPDHGLSPGSSAAEYVSKTAFELPFDVNITQLQKAWTSIAKDSPILRTRIVDIPGEGLVQVVVGSQVTLARYADIGDFVKASQPMGLGVPLCRAGIVEVDRPHLILEMHHSIFDGWSTMLILDAVEAVYNESQQKLQPLPFKSFVKQILATDSIEASRFWQDQLAGSEATVFPSPNYTPERKVDFHHTISELQWLRTGITPSSAVRSALALLLASYTNSSDVKYGATVSGRQARVPGIERIAGPTIATVPVRVKFDWDQTVQTLQKQIQLQTVEATEHEQFGLQRIHHISPEVEEASNFQLLLVVQPTQQWSSQKPGGLFSQAKSLLTATDCNLGHDQEQTSSDIKIVTKDGQADSVGIYNPYAMMIICQLQDSGLVLNINFDSGAIDQREVQRIAGQFEHLLRQLCSEESSQLKLREIAPLTKDDLTEIWGWNNHLQEEVVEPTTSLIDSRAAKKPKSTAISAWDTQVTYQQLGDSSRALASQLQQEGVAPGSIIVLSFEKSSWLIISMIAAFRVGAVALPMSSPVSSQRALQIVENLNPRLVITSTPTASSPFNELVPTVSISELIIPNGKPSGYESQSHINQPSDPALILFTSGSTGMPKAIQWSHATLSSNVKAAISAFNLTSDSRVFQFAGYDFDVSTVEALSTLSAGGCLCIPSESDRKNRLAGAINDTNANWICLTPSVAETLAPADVPSLRTVIFAGEKLQEATASRWAEGLDVVYNWYGPAEASVATTSIVQQGKWKPGMIGRGQYGTTWLTDPKDSSRLAPVGAIAELCIEGPILARYSGNSGPEYNEKSFLSPPWLHHGHETPKRRGPVYKTGDLVKYASDGRIIFIGRTQDAQRKLRGQRIDLSEIERCVQAFLLDKKLSATVVAEIFSPSQSDKDTLALFISPADAVNRADSGAYLKRSLPVDDLETHLLNFVPSYMIPTIYIPVSEVPIGPTGKTDRVRLRQIGSSLTLERLAEMQPGRRKSRKPATEMERQLQHQWAEILGIKADAIHATDHFLRLGGDSISAMRLVALLRNQGFTLTVADVFEAPVLENMVNRVEKDTETAELDEVAPFSLLDPSISEAQIRSQAVLLCSITEDQVMDVYPCTALQEGLLALGTRRNGQYVSRSVLGLQGSIDPDRLRGVWRTTIAKLPILRTRIVNIPGQGLMQVLVNDIPLRSGSDVEDYLRQDEQEPMELGTELCRAAIIGRSFIFTIHHCLYDGKSFKMVLDELESLYFGNTGIEITPFQNFIRYLSQSDPQEAAGFWKKRLSSAEFRQFPILPSAAYEPQASESLEHSISLSWPQKGMTPSTMIRAAWSVLTSQYVSSNDVVFGVTVSGRQSNMKAVENCVGPTIATVPIAVSIDWDETIETFLGRIQRQGLDITPYEQYGMQNIQRALGDLSSSLFQALLVIQPVAEGKSLHEDNLLFKARSFASNLDTQGTDPFNTHALMVICQLTTTGLKLQISFDPIIIDKLQMGRIACQFETILGQLCMENSDSTKLDVIQTASDLDLEIFWTQNAAAPKQTDTCVHDFVTLAARSQPDAVAIDAWDGQFSYRELDEITSTLAHKLIHLGLTKGSIVALSFEKSKWTPIAQIAVLKAGAVTLLQSAAVPEERLARVFKNLGVQLALASKSRVDLVSNYARCLTIEELMNEHLDSSVIAPLPILEMGDPAAILVSSGSTGEPKQILWSHEALTANTKAYSEHISINPSTRIFQFASYDFDVSTVEMISGLINTACLCIPSESERLNDIITAINRFDANCASITRSTAKLLRPEELRSLTTLVLAGENLLQEDVDRWRDYCHIINWYGPAESSAAAFCAADSSTWQTGVIGHINSGNPYSRCWLVDPRNSNRLVPFGAVGELVFEGTTSADGYIGNSVLTEERFRKSLAFLSLGTPSIRAGRPGRAYITGDLARYDSNGNLIFLGRKDAQLKIRGQLVAPEEVEYQIRRSLNLKGDDNDIDVIIDAVSPASGSELALVAFIVTQGDINALTNGLKEKLQKTLPRYAIPSYFIPISTVPTTPTGKRDRAQLLEIAASFEPQQQEGTRRSPETATEIKLAKLWSAALGTDVESIYANDSFLRFGNSIEAMLLVGIARQQGVLLTVANIFEHPVLKDMAKLLKDVNDATDEVIEPFTLLNPDQDIDKARQQAAVLCGVSINKIEDVFPCTQLQEGLLALTMKREGAYTGHNILDLGLGVDITRFKKAWEEVVERIPILRTRIVDLPGQGLVQVVVQEGNIWTEASDIDDYLHQEKEVPMGLGSPLMRSGLLPRSNANEDLGSDPGQFCFALTMHHSVYDGLTVSLILESLESIYNGKAPLRPCPFQSFVKYIASRDEKEAVEFWKAQFEGLEAAQFPALPSATYQPQTDCTWTVSLKDLHWRTDDFTPSTIIRAAFGLLFAQYSNSSDVVFGTVVMGRKAPIAGTERLAGPTIATLPVRVQVDGEATVPQLLAAVQKRETEMIPFEQTGLSRIRKASDEAEHASGFQTLVVVQLPEQKMEDSGLFVSQPNDRPEASRYHGFSSYALSVVCNLEENGLTVEFCYDSTVVEPETIQRMGPQLELILKNLCTQSLDETTICNLSMIPEDDLDKVWEWNSESHESIERCMHDMVSEVAQRQPDATAICAWDGELTYGMLDQLSTKIAVRLAAMGVSKNMIVPLCFEKSKFAMLALFSVMKAGGAGLLLDPTLPESRLQAILRQVNTPFIISSVSNEELCSGLIANPVILGTESDLMRECTDDNISNDSSSGYTLPSVSPSDLLFTIFTSGSTGTPKGCLIQHRHFGSATVHQRKTLRLDETSRMYDFSSYSFDAVYWCAFHVLTAGGTLCIPSEEERKSELTESIRRFKTTDIFLTPATARWVDPQRIPTLRSIYLGGEKVTSEDLAVWTPYANTFVVYGPAECSTMSTAGQVPTPIPTRPSIGHGTGVSTWVVDPRSSERLSPVGTVGELYVEGPLVGQGYLGDEVKTASVFIEDPSWLLRGSPNGSVPGRRGRLYKTGDLVKYDPVDGSIIFVERKDTQVKLRGQRIELSEVEHHVRNCLTSKFSSNAPVAVAEIIVPSVTGRPILVVFIQCEEESTSDLVSHLELNLSDSLPVYMVPGAYVSIQSIPVTQNGKTDRKRLRELGANMTLDQLTGSVAPANGESPRSESELCLQTLWVTVLGISTDSIGTDSSFLRLGGDSISAMRLASLARSKGISLTVQKILTAPRLSDMAEGMANFQSSGVVHGEIVEPFSLLKHPKNKDTILGDISRQCSIDVSQIEDIFPCTGVQKSLLSMTAKRDNSYIARMLLKLRKDVNVTRLINAWEEVSKTTAPILRCRIVDSPTEGLVQVQVREPLAWNTCDDIETFLKQDESKPMGLATPLARLAIVGDSKNAEGYYCLLTQHHAMYDGYSLNLLFQEVSKAYAGSVDTSPIASFQAFMKQVGGVDRESAREFWSQEFSESEAIPFPQLPHVDYQPKADSTVRRELVDFQWPKRDATPSTIIRAAWSILTARYMDTDDVVFGAMVSGRQAPLPGIDRMIAPLINVVPVRVKFDITQTVDQLLHDIQNQSIAMIAYEQTELLEIRRINTSTDRGSRANTLLVVQPAGHESSKNHSDGPYEDQASVTTVSKDLDDFNPNAVMIIFQLTENNGLQFEISFDSKVVDQAQMERIASQFEHVLRQVCASTTQPIDAIETVSSQDIEELWQWNASVPRAIPECVHDLIGNTIKQQPEAPAICSWDGNLSYAELDDLSSRLASQLVARGAGPGTVIPLCFQKSMWHPVGALGVMKSGAACLSMDSTQPESRLKSIVGQVKPNWVLSSATTQALASQISDAEVIIVDRDHILQSPSSSTELSLPTVHSSDVLYVVFTSGSTGTPKGVVTTHENFVSAATHQTDILHIQRGTRVFDFVSYSFDVSWSNTLQTLICGGCLCIPSEWERRNDISGAFNRMECVYSYFTPSVARSLDPSAMPALRTLAMGGEPIQSKEVARWTQAETVIGIYGPAECAQALSFIRLSKDTLNNQVGHSFGAKTWLVQPGCPDRLAAIGTIGELMIEGPSVSRGYFRDTEKTAASYIENPTWLHQGTLRHAGRHATLYKTGDLLRYNSDGSLNFIGRKDGMVKLRGQRIELAEVEYHVRASLTNPDLCDGIAAEIITPQNSTSAILAVFVQVSMANKREPDDDTLSELMRVIEGLEDRLSERVPQYMVPGAYIPVEKIPMTTTNKTDRRVLRELGNAQTLEKLAKLQSHGKHHYTPSTVMEKRLQQLWSSVLGVDADSISAESSFLRIGGESIAAMQLVAAARGQKLSLTVADIFKTPRLSQLALTVKEIVAEESLRPQLPFSLLEIDNPEAFVQTFIEPSLDVQFGSISDVIPCTDFQKVAILDALQSPPSRLPQWIFDLPADVDFSRLERACQKLVDHYEILRTVFVEAQGLFWQVLLDDFKPTYDTFDANDEDITAFTRFLCEQDLKRPRQLGRSFIRFIAIRHRAGKHKLVFRISHAQFDGYSWGMVLQALSSIYCEEGLPESSPFSQYIAYREKKKEEGLQYWASRLQESLYPSWSTADSSDRIYTTADRLTIKETFEMPKFNGIEGVSAATIFHAACAIALSRQFRQSQVVFGRLVTGRSMLPSGLQNVVGPTMTEIPIIIRVTATDTLSSVASRLQDQFIEDSMHEAAGMEDIARKCTIWPEDARDFGWRTAFQQGEDSDGTFLGSPSAISVHDSDLLPRTRPEVYATPREGMLDLEFEGNRRLIEEDTVREFLHQVQTVLCGVPN